MLGDVLLDLVHETDLVCSIDCRGCNLAEQIIPSVLQSMGVNPYALFAKQEVILMFDLMVCNVTTTPAHSDLHRLNHKYNKNLKEI